MQSLLLFNPELTKHTQTFRTILRSFIQITKRARAHTHTYRRASFRSISSFQLRSYGQQQRKLVSSQQRGGVRDDRNKQETLEQSQYCTWKLAVLENATVEKTQTALHCTGGSIFNATSKFDPNRESDETSRKLWTLAVLEKTQRTALHCTCTGARINRQR